MAENPNIGEEVKTDLLYGLFTRAVSVWNLPKGLYFDTARELKKGLYKGYKGTKMKFAFDSPDLALINELRTNIYMFSAAKTFQQTLEMSDALVNDEGILRPFAEFKKIAGEIFDTYNETYLKTEYDTAIGQSRAAAKWNDLQKYKKAFPYIKYSAVMDSHTCEICQSLDGLIAKVDDPVWNENMPLNHFNCECTVEQLDEEDAEEEGITDSDEKKEMVSKSQANKDPLFNMNPGKSKEIFLSTGRYKHPYFDVSKQYRKLAENNFGLPIPTEE